MFETGKRLVHAILFVRAQCAREIDFIFSSKRKKLDGLENFAAVKAVYMVAKVTLKKQRKAASRLCYLLHTMTKRLIIFKVAYFQALVRKDQLLHGSVWICSRKV